jgi:BON domain
MTRILGCALVIALLGAPTVFCQQPQQNPPGAPGTNPDRSAPPSSAATSGGGSLQDKAVNNAQMERDISDVLSGDPALRDTDVQASVDDVNITLTGSVQSQAQVERVVALVSPYARYRNIVNKVTIK